MDTDRRTGLYWCTTDDHDEDRFVIAGSADEAAAFHEDEEGYNEGDARADLVCELPEDYPEIETGYPSDEVIRDCGGVFVQQRSPRRVRLGGRDYEEGALQTNVQSMALRTTIVPDDEDDDDAELPPKEWQH